MSEAHHEPGSAPRVLAIVPCFNEAEAVATTVRSLQQASPDIRVLVVNDGSTDATAEIASRLDGVALLDLPLNLGIGGAVQAGFRYFLATDCDVAVQFDGDGQHPGDQVMRLVSALKPPIEAVVGSRFIDRSQDGYRSTAARRMGIRILRRLIHLLTGVYVTDATSGFRAYSRRAVEMLVDDYPDDYPEPVSTVLLARRGLEIVEVPVQMRERQGGVSSIRGFVTLYYMLKVSLAILVARVGTIRGVR